MFAALRMNKGYFTRFELISERERGLFNAVGTGIKKFGNWSIDAYKKTPIYAKVGGIVAFSVLGTIGTMSMLEKKVRVEEDSIIVRYAIEHAPLDNPTYHSDVVNSKELKELIGTPGVRILSIEGDDLR